MNTSDIFDTVAAQNCIKIVDPAMADNGSLNPGFDAAFVESMKELCMQADYIIPNITEACLLTDTEYLEEYDYNYTISLLAKLTTMGCRNVILTVYPTKQARPA